MAYNYTKTIVSGKLARDAETRTFQNGDKVCNLSIPTSERWRDKSSGEMKEKTQWHNIVVRNQHIIKFAENLKKGALVIVEGQNETRKYTDKDGAERQSFEIVLAPFRGELVVLDYNDSDDDEPEQEQPALAKAPTQAQPRYDSRTMNDDEIPF